jgi:hypothetical protein
MEIQPRQQNVTELIHTLDYPFEFIRTGEYDRRVKEIPGQPIEDIGNFPDNIAHYYWISPGENDEKPWLTLCCLDNGIYVFYKGECDYTGFDCQGNMEIYASRDVTILLHYGMTRDEYEKYVHETNL